MNKKIWVAVVVVAIVALVGWRMYRGQGVNEGTIKIGAVYGLSGSAATWSEYGKKAADLAVDEINNNGGVRGRKIEIVYEDGKTTPASDVSAFQKLITVDRVAVVIGDVWSFITNPLIPIAGDNKVLLISPTVMDKSVEGGNDYFYTLGHTVDSQRSAVDQFLAMNPTAKTAAVLCWDDAWGQSHKTLFTDALRGKGVKIIATECNGDYSYDYRATMAKIRSLNPDILLVTVSSGDGINFFKTRHDFGVTAPTLTTNVVVDVLENQKMPRAYGLGIYFTNWLPDQDFINKFQAAYGIYPSMENQNSYEAVRSIAKAFENNPQNVLAGLRRVKYQGVDGPIDFTTASHIQIDNAVAGLYRVDQNGYTKL